MSEPCWKPPSSKAKENPEGLRALQAGKELINGRGMLWIRKEKAEAKLEPGKKGSGDTSRIVEKVKMMMPREDPAALLQRITLDLTTDQETMLGKTKVDGTEVVFTMMMIVEEAMVAGMLKAMVGEKFVVVLAAAPSSSFTFFIFEDWGAACDRKLYASSTCSSRSRFLMRRVRRRETRSTRGNSVPTDD